MAIAYLLGKASAKALHTKINIPLILVASILPDIDIVFSTISGTELHRGITHSILFAVILFLPFFWKYKKQAIPYFIAFLSHSLIADFIMGGNVQLLWPLQASYGLAELGGPFIDVFSVGDEIVELALFAVAVTLMIKTGDYRVFFKADKTNLFMIIPTATVLLPPLIGYPLSQPLICTFPALALSHVVCLVVFVAAITITLRSLKSFQDLYKPN
ncbi:MAG: metal-dependent hydrolase [Candidatus Bathyarchaeota archaeon]|nr:metal-dependent hydrolase [Candidatus Bathyarchaeota archaeon]